MVRNAFSPCTNGDSITIISFSCKWRTAEEQRDSPLPSVTIHWLLMCITEYFFPSIGLPFPCLKLFEESLPFTQNILFSVPYTRRGQHFPWNHSHKQQGNCLLLPLGPREEKALGYTNNKFFLGRAALCTGRKVVTLGREQQHTAQPRSWLGFPSIFLFVITNIL